MDGKQKKIFGVMLISVVLFAIGFLFMFGFLTKSEVHFFTHEFEYQDSIGLLTLRFESKTGVFTVGQEILIDAFLTLPEFSSNDNRIHLLYFPNSFTTLEYQELLKKENFAKVTMNEDGSGFTFDVAQHKIFTNLGNFPPQAELKAVWTQDGPKNAILQIDAESISFSEKDIKNKGIEIENVITIQPSDVKIQMQSNNVSMGLALIITGISIITGFFGMEKISSQKEGSKKK